MKSGSILGVIALVAAAAPAHADRSMDSVNKVIQGHAPELRGCYQREVEGDGADKPSGKLVVKLTIRREGTTARVRIGDRSTLRHERLERCVLKIFRAMRFGPDDDPAEITYPLFYQTV